MEKWKEAFAGMIPHGNYQTRLTYGEEKGLVLALENDINYVVLNFGAVRAIRILDEGIVQKELYADSAIEGFKKGGFQNVIYEAAGGEFSSHVQNIADAYWEFIEAKHYVVITQNYNIDIITEREPEIHVF